MEFQRKTIPFLHKGMNWDTPVEKLPDGMLPWAKNVRVLEVGSISSAHGHTLQTTVNGATYVHSISRLNITNPGYYAYFKRTMVLGVDKDLYVYQGVNPGNAPVTTPLGTGAFSGNPLAIVDAQPVGAAAAWKYIGDSLQMVTVGYYPSDSPGAEARALTIGLAPPVNTEAVTLSAGQLTGNYQWCFAYRRVQTGARSNPSAATRFQVNQPAHALTNQQATFQLPYPPNDPLTGAPDTNIWVDIYRFGGAVLRWALVGSGPGGSMFTDNTLDEQLLAAPSPSQTTDATTGLTRFNLYQPFVTQDIHREQTGGTLSQMPGGQFILTSTGFQNWLPGSTIYLNGTACTIYQVQSPTVVELAEDLTNVLQLGTYTWDTDAGTLMAGQPLPHLWGPYGVGQSASYIFACGDPNGPGTLYWTNGNDPDSTDIVNNIEVCSPSEKLMSGATYDGQPYVWSTERQFQIFPSLTVFGQFTTQEMAGAKGCWLEWSLSVQSNGISDQSVTWRGKDGIYDWSAANGLQRLTDPLYAFFPHDNNPGIAPETIMPFIGPGTNLPENVGNLDDTQPQYHRTCWFQGMLFYDFVAQTTPQGNTFSTLVWDSVNAGGSWISLDQPFGDTTRPLARGIEIGANEPVDVDNTSDAGPLSRGGNLLVAWGDSLYSYFGYNRGGMFSRVITRAEDLGDSRVPKLWGDCWLDCTPLSPISVTPLVSFNNTAMTRQSFPLTGSASGTRQQFVIDFPEFEDAGGQGLLNATLALDIQWQAENSLFTTSIYQWQPSFIAKPEVIIFRASDRDDGGAVQAKYLMGANIEANTFATAITVNVWIDGTSVAQLILNHNGQSEFPYAWTPVAGYEFQVQLFSPAGANWELFKINWIFQPWPDAVARYYPFQDLGTSGAKYVRGVELPMETGGAAGVVALRADDGAATRTWSKSTPNLLKSGIVLDLPAPFVAHELQFMTQSAIRIWPTEAKIDFDPWPELSNEVSSFMNLGYEGAKFMQGAIVPMVTNGQPIQLTVNADCGGTSVTLPAVTTPTDCKMEFAFSFSPCNSPPSNPFIAHEVQVVPSGDARIWYDEIRWVWEPAPEIAYTWQTQETDHDLAGFHSMRDAFIAYMGGPTAGTAVLIIKTEYGTLTYNLGAFAANQYQRFYLPLQPQKAKWRSYRVESCQGLRLYIKDTSVRVKEWGSTGPYINAQPFGDLSRTNGGARI